MTINFEYTCKTLKDITKENLQVFRCSFILSQPKISVRKSANRFQRIENSAQIVAGKSLLLRPFTYAF